MEYTDMTWSAGHDGDDAPQVRVQVPVLEPRPLGEARLLAFGDFTIAPSGPPLID